MNTFKLKPEGWNKEVTQIKKENIEEYIQTKETLQGIVNKCDEQYNLHIKIGNNFEGIMPREEVESINLDSNGLPKTNLCTGKVNKFIQFKIKDIDNSNTPILSRREVQQETLKWIKKELKVGQRISGVVKNIKPYGAFIEIAGGVVGLIHIEDLSIARIKTPYERLKIGQRVEVVVKSIDREGGKVILSHKEVLGSWEENAERFETGTKVKGIIRETEKNKNGIFIELTPNLIGMAEYEEGLEYGKKVDVYIKKIDKEKKKIKLLIID